jgi:hypothetical protein
MIFHGGIRKASRLVLLTGLLLLVAGPAQGFARELFQFEPGKHGAGSLEMLGSVPIAVVEGSPEEMGEQLGALLAGPLEDMVEQKNALLRGFGLSGGSALVLQFSTLLAGRIPPDHMTELKAVGKSAGIGNDFLILGNVIYDVGKIGACSALMVDADHSATGQIVFGRNMDFPSFGFLDRVGLVVVYRGTGKHALASITFPGFLGCISGINDAGLAVAQLEVLEAGDGSSRFDPVGMPLAFCFRRVLEDCATIDEAEKLLGQLQRTSMCNMAICDTKSMAVLEITNRTVVRRAAADGFCACTNHFRTDQLGPAQECRRYDRLCQAFGNQKLSLSEVAKKLDQTNQGALTIQTMIFEPNTRHLHLVMGPGPVSAKPLQLIELAPLLKKDRATASAN